MVKAQKIVKSYQKDGNAPVEVLKDITFAIDAGEFISIRGSSGAGKSTLLNILGCLDKPTSGTYELDNVDVAPLSDNALSDLRNRKIGFVFQSFNLLARTTAQENVELPLMYSDLDFPKDAALQALDAVGLIDRATHFPNELSGGEQQRVAIARALINDPALILADEPTGNLDTKAGLEVMAILQKLHRNGRTIIMVTHDADIAEHADRIVQVSDGRIVQDERVTEPKDATASQEVTE
ncbi:MAG: ABC transporter ATP-binding protein [Candidatus Latescibacteria bacterium]|nr:ABC transporter ATP-binding protein [Candidatus Latescibacterota bacterium]